jgi:hypothetical protein
MGRQARVMGRRDEKIGRILLLDVIGKVRVGRMAVIDTGASSHH